MPRFSDDWVVDRTLFEFASGGSCACCGLSHLFHPDGLKGLIDDISDLETDAAADELSAAKRSPWPPQMRDQVWADRVRLRHKLKKEMKAYEEFMAEIGGPEGLKAWIVDEIGPAKMRRILQMPRTEVSERIRSQYGIHSGLGIVICAVVEQVANFPITKYPPDGRSESELAFEGKLTYDRRGGFVLPVAVKDEETRKWTDWDEDGLDILVATVASLGGPKLLHRAPRKVKASSSDNGDEDNDDDNDADDADDAEGDGDGDEAHVPGQRGPSFRSDRRIVRLLIARYWADQIIAKYQSIKKEKEEEEQQKVEAGDGAGAQPSPSSGGGGGAGNVPIGGTAADGSEEKDGVNAIGEGVKTLSAS